MCCLFATPASLPMKELWRGRDSNPRGLVYEARLEPTPVTPLCRAQAYMSTIRSGKGYGGLHGRVRFAACTFQQQRGRPWAAMSWPASLGITPPDGHFRKDFKELIRAGTHHHHAVQRRIFAVERSHATCHRYEAVDVNAQINQHPVHSSCTFATQLFIYV